MREEVARAVISSPSKIKLFVWVKGESFSCALSLTAIAAISEAFKIVPSNVLETE